MREYYDDIGDGIINTNDTINDDMKIINEADYEHETYFVDEKGRRKYKKLQLFSCNQNCMGHNITHALGRKYDIKKGTLGENKLWCVKDSTQKNGNFYYFDNPEEAERLLKVTYNIKDKKQWQERNNV